MSGLLGLGGIGANGGLSGIANDVGGAVSDLYSAQGSFAAAKEYNLASDMATENAQIEQQATAIKENQQQRQFEMVAGQGQAQVAGSGFTAGGSASDILRSSTQQSALAHAAIGAQGFINETSYKQQAAAFTAEAQQANAAAHAGILGGIMKGVGALASFL